ncbi:MAG: BirA family biotin operon repressor/biotin-[acetyl-CoA-carboxylase] ligase [Vicingaceae bacterium]|jgi:BirA family biotin operon repressor/biotin-[acetyl-CoA-carboxylase] ligase
MDSSDFNFQFTRLSSLQSTNIYALELLRQKKGFTGTVIVTDFQTKGKGQQGKIWESKKGKNLQFSIIISPKLAVEKQFELSQFVAICLRQWLDSMSVSAVQIKWPNDILVNGKKIAGVLIENSIQGQEISHSVIGIGLNVNQVGFSIFSRLATSLKKELNKNVDMDKALTSFLELFKSNYLKYKSGQLDVVKLYLSYLFGLGTPQRYVDDKGEFLGVILGVRPNGKLQVNKNGKLKSYDIKQLQFLD